MRKCYFSVSRRISWEMLAPSRADYRIAKTTIPSVMENQSSFRLSTEIKPVVFLLFIPSFVNQLFLFPLSALFIFSFTLSNPMRNIKRCFLDLEQDGCLKIMWYIEMS